MIKLTIDQKPVSVTEGTTILEAAEKAGINVSAVLQAALKKELAHN